MNDESEKNSLFNQESIIDEKSLKIKIYDYFYSIIKEKKDFNLSVLCILIVLEIIQLISYAFSEPHLNSWKIKSSQMKIISIILGALRISPLMAFVKYNFFIVIFFILIALIFVFSIFILMQVLFRKSTSKLSELCTSFTQIIINPLVIFLYIPITEIMLMQFKCSNGIINVIINADKCGTGIYYLYVVLGAIFAFIFFLCLLFHLLFYFSPFQYQTSTIKINPNNDIILLISKFIFILRFIWVQDEYLSIVILLFISLFSLINEYTSNTYNNTILEIILNVRNVTVFWTYFVLLLSKFFENTKIDGAIYILLFGYPVVIYLGIIQFNINESKFMHVQENLTDVNRYIYQTKFFVKLIDSFLINNKNLKYSNELENNKNDILIRGIIKTHIKSCVNDDCPLIKFMQNQGNYNIQKQCLLNYMNIHFNNGIKAFPSNCKIKIYYIQFNYNKRYNLNGVKTNLAALSKLKMNFKEEYITYCLKQEIKKVENKTIDYNDNNETEFESDLIDQKYRRLKYLIENATKLYVEFWGIFASNITNNLNSQKIYCLGEKLNKYLNEMKYLWTNDLKNKKIDLEHQGVVQLYSKFLKEILWDQKKSIDVSKKINDNHHHHHESKKNDDDNNQSNNNIDSILENQDYLIFANSNEKGKCNIIQCSNSISFLLGYQKTEIIGKPIEILMPNLFIEGHKKMLEDRIKTVCIEQDSKRDSFRESTKKQIFILAQSKIGYLIPLNTKYNIYDDNDYSNTFIIKAKMELKDMKSVYAYYILTKDDFTIINISSSALNLGISMDLLKKYVMKINLLIRGKNDEEINLFERYTEYEEEPKPVTWVFPDVIYPKDDTKRTKEEDIQFLIEASNKKKYNLQINTFRYNEEQILGFSFRFTEINTKRKKNIQFGKFLPIKKQEVMFDLLNLNYIRTIIVKQKTGLRNLRESDNDESNDLDKNISINKEKEKRKKKRNEVEEIQESSDEDDTKQNEFILTREKVLELQTRETADVKQFIYQLPFYGNDVSLEKHRPNKEKYPVGRTAEPSIKIQLSHFIKRMDDKKADLSKMIRKMQATNTIEKETENNTNDNNLNDNYLSSSSFNQSQETKNAEEINREISTDTNASLSKLFKAKSLTYMSISSVTSFIFVCLITSLDFACAYVTISKIGKRLTYAQKSYKLLNNILYIKYFITEGVIANELKSRINESYICLDETDINTFSNNIRNELSKLRQEFTEEYSTFTSSSSKFSDRYVKYISETNLSLSGISGNNTIKEKFQLSTAMDRIPANIFYISTTTNNAVINMTDRNVYELMHNLLNDYFNSWKNATFISVEDAINNTSKNNTALILLVLSFVISVIYMVVIWKLLNAFGMSREKPITLLLTIKKKIFENLKNSAENFSNKLLNKFFGNEDNEEESQQDYQSNVQMNDINIVKFKSPISSINKENLYISLFIQISLFFIIIDIYMIYKYFYTKSVIINIAKYIGVYNITEYSQVNAILSIDIVKSYFFDSTIPIFSIDNSKEPFQMVFYVATNTLEDNSIATSESSSFLKGYYKEQFTKYYYNDFSDFIPDEYKNKNLTQNGFKSMIIKLFGTLKYLSFVYFLNSNYYANDTTINLINDKNWIELNKYTQNFIRYWFKGIIELIIKAFKDYINKAILIQITSFVLIIAFLIFYYMIILSGQFESFISLLNQSRDLINLIPEEIKYIIIAKLNE